MSFEQIALMLITPVGGLLLGGFVLLHARLNPPARKPVPDPRAKDDARKTL